MSTLSAARRLAAGCAGIAALALLAAFVLLRLPAAAEAAACTASELASGITTCACPVGTSREGRACAAPLDARFKGPRKHVLLRPVRLQFCMRELGHYDGPLSGRMTTSTLRALGKVRVAAKLKYPRDAARDGPLHAEVWRLCRLIWLSRATDRSTPRSGGSAG